MGSNLDLMQEWIFPKLEKDDQITSLLVCKSQGKTIMEVLVLDEHLSNYKRGGEL